MACSTIGSCVRLLPERLEVRPLPRQLILDNSKAKKCQQLGMDPGTVSNRLRKALLFDLVQALGRDTCFHCHLSIENVEEFSIEHKEPWLDSEDPTGLFFNLDNIAFSHLRCNVAASRSPHQKYFTDEEKLEARRRIRREGMKRNYSTEKRRLKFKRTGH